MRLRPLLLALAPCAALACRGSESVPQRNSIVDSRDTYDPRSLDPALSTDVPTGRAVSYVFDGLTRFTPEARVEPGRAEPLAPIRGSAEFAAGRAKSIAGLSVPNDSTVVITLSEALASFPKLL